MPTPLEWFFIIFLGPLPAYCLVCGFVSLVSWLKQEFFSSPAPGASSSSTTPTGWNQGDGFSDWDTHSGWEPGGFFDRTCR
jgi:hypothetical protein